jgi:hypothetical protein
LHRGVERQSGGWYLSAAAFAAAGVLIKFPALALVPMFAVVAVRKRRWGPLLVIAGPLGALFAWQTVSRALYGATQVHAGLSFLGQFQSSLLRQVAERALTMLALLAWTFPACVLVVSRLSRRAWTVVSIAAVLAVASAGVLLGPRCWERPGQSGAMLAGVGLGSVGLVSGLFPGRLRPSTHGRQNRDDSRPFLWAWIFGVASIVIPFGPFVAVRSFLPIHPPLALLLLSRGPARRRRLVAAVGVTAVLGASLAAADFRWAACYPATASRLAADWSSRGRPIVFLGHWGWQYYAERAGFRPWDARWREVPPGAIVIIPRRADQQWMYPDVVRRLQSRERITIAHGPLWLTTWNREIGVRFYGGDYGELPWGFSSQPAEEFFVCEAGPAAIR